MKIRFTVPLPKESEIKKAILQYLALRGVFAFTVHTTGVPRGNGVMWKNYSAGVSDILGVMKGGRFIAIEVKTPKGKASDKQKQFLLNVIDKGGLGFFASSVDCVKSILDGLDEPEAK